MHMRLCAALFNAIGCYALLWRCRAVLCGNMRLWAALDLSGSVAAKKKWPIVTLDHDFIQRFPTPKNGVIGYRMEGIFNGAQRMNTKQNPTSSFAFFPAQKLPWCLKNLLSCRCSLEPSQWWFQLWICVWHSWRVCLWVHFKDGSFWICLRAPVRDTCIPSAVIGHILALLSSYGSGKKYVPQTWMSYTANSSIKVYCPNILIPIKKQMAAKIGKK